MPEFIVMRPANPDELLAWVAVIPRIADVQALSDGEKGALIGHINAIIGKINRYRIFKFLFAITSSKELTDAQWWWLKMWVDVKYTAEVWEPSLYFIWEVIWLLDYLDQAEAHLIKEHIDGNE